MGDDELKADADDVKTDAPAEDEIIIPLSEVFTQKKHFQQPTQHFFLTQPTVKSSNFQFSNPYHHIQHTLNIHKIMSAFNYPENCNEPTHSTQLYEHLTFFTL